MAVTTALLLTEIHEAAAIALEPDAENDPAILVEVVDSLSPPAIMLLWDDPWLIPGGSAGPVMGPCLFTARMLLLCIAGRADPGTGFAQLTELVSYAVGRLRDDPAYQWPHPSALAPRIFPIGGIEYLGARLTYPVTTAV